jgi:hypothetical protein
MLTLVVLGKTQPGTGNNTTLNRIASCFEKENHDVHVFSTEDKASMDQFHAYMSSHKVGLHAASVHVDVYLICC